MFGKSDALNDVLCFRREFKGGPYSNSAIKLPIQPSELIKKHAHKCPIPDAGHLHEEMLQLQITSQGSSHTHVTARKACQTMCIINHSLSHMHECANWCHETSSTVVNPGQFSGIWVVLVGFSYVVGYWHGLEGQRILYCRVVNLMYINELWLYNCGDYMNALKLYVVQMMFCSCIFL